MLPPTSDILWMLADTLSNHPDVDTADSVLGAYVDWLERTQRRVRKWSYFDGAASRNGKEPFEGWVSERAIVDRVDLWATAFAVNALLGIRDLMEFRLSQICERRFTILEAQSKLHQIDPVDVGNKHAHRLHHRLYRMARQTDGPDFKSADYSMILHGPPGTSKTAVIQALSDEMWRHARRRSRGGRWARLVRITPADFTRLGEQRLDSEAALIFESLGRLRGVTILFDEIDDLLKQRNLDERLRFIELVVPAMLNRLQDLRDVCPRQEIAFLLATNYVEKIEPALLRPGRIDQRIPVVYPDRKSRLWMVARKAATLREKLENAGRSGEGETAERLFINLMETQVDRLTGAPWKTIENLLKMVEKKVMRRLEDAKKGEALKNIKTWTKKCRDEIAGEVHDLRSDMRPPPYVDRFRSLPTSPELRNEVLAVALAAATHDEATSEKEGLIASLEEILPPTLDAKRAGDSGDAKGDQADEKSQEPLIAPDKIDSFLKSRGFTTKT